MDLFLPRCGRQVVSTEILIRESDRDWLRYTHALYPFSVAFPADWNLSEGENYVCLFPQSEPTVMLVIGFKYADESIHILRSGVPAGDAVDGGTVQFLGQTIRKTIIRYEGMDKVVLYGYKEDLPYQIHAGTLIFTISLDDFRLEYEEVDLSAEMQALADAIVANITLRSPSP